MKHSSPSARSIALDCLDAVIHRHQALDETLAVHNDLSRLESRDRAFVRLLVTTVLRRTGQMDALVSLWAPTPPSDTVQMILRLGLAQILFLDTPPHAAVSTALDLAEERKEGHAKGFINALLRRAVREGKAIVAVQDEARLNMPAWLLESWTSAWGEKTALEIARASLVETSLDLSLVSPDQTEEWAGRLEAVALPTGTLRRAGGGLVTDLPGFSEGAWWVQDAAAALPVKLLGNIHGKTVVDLCAAPGGKTCQLAAAGGDIIAVDRSEKRMERVTENLARLHLNARMVVADAANWKPDSSVDAVLLDAPCTATGTIRRHPDIPWLKRPEDVAKLAVTQARLLDAAVGMLKPGGVLVYCVCSLQPEEGEHIIREALARHPSLTLQPVTAEETGGLAEAVTPEGFLRTLPCHWPDRGGLDGFFAARVTSSS
ncbi:MAG: methyltransferase domain-containing protein [Pseudomonadota bacterium]|nr:methyltransferase domain-containing protein [Pseudomonadota bacterium]